MKRKAHVGKYWRGRCTCGHSRWVHSVLWTGSIRSPIVCRYWKKCGCQDYHDDEPEPPSEIIIERHYGAWCFEVGSHRGFVRDQHGHEFPDYTDPMVVAKALKARAAGPVCVVVNL